RRRKAAGARARLERHAAPRHEHLHGAQALQRSRRRPEPHRRHDARPELRGLHGDAQRQGRQLMAGRIIAGLGAPHAPSIAVARNTGKTETPAVNPLVDAYKPMTAWMQAKRPDLIILIANDHANTFFFDRYPCFALGVAPLHEIADEGWGRWPFDPVPGAP